MFVLFEAALLSIKINYTHREYDMSVKKIRNRDEILSHGDKKSRQVVLDIAEKTLQKLDSRERIKSIMPS